MTRLLGAELLKLRTTLVMWAYLVVVAAVAAVSVAGAIGPAPEELIPDQRWVRENVLAAAGSASLFALLLGIVGFTNEFRHGTATQTFLVTPVRELVLGGKVIAYALVGACLALVACVVTLAIAIPWLSARGGSVDLDGSALAVLGGAVLSSALWGALGAAIGGFVRNQVLALVGTLIWILILEHLVVALLDDVAPYLPSRASGAIVGSDFLAEGLSRSGAALVALAYVAAFAALALVTLRRDVN